MVVVVFIVFIMMVLFMKVFPKRKFYAETISSTKIYPDLSTAKLVNSSALNSPFKNEF
jgi:hypothetical protein